MPDPEPAGAVPACPNCHAAMQPHNPTIPTLFGTRAWRCWPCGVHKELSDRLATALNVALSWHDNPTQGTAADRDLELAGCREVLREWTDAD